MTRVLSHTVAVPLAWMLSVAPVFADATPQSPVVEIDTLGGLSDYPALTRGQVVVVNAQRFVVAQEPPPVAAASEAPPEPKVVEVEENRPPAPSATAVWVAGHWVYGAAGFSWVAGRYVAARAGHVFVPPRWAVFQEQYLFFSGFYVPRGVYVRSHFNRYYYSGAPKTGLRAAHGPYWPVGAPSRANSASTSAGARDPYWPVGVRR